MISAVCSYKKETKNTTESTSSIKGISHSLFIGKAFESHKSLHFSYFDEILSCILIEATCK